MVPSRKLGFALGLCTLYRVVRQTLLLLTEDDTGATGGRQLKCSRLFKEVLLKCCWLVVVLAIKDPDGSNTEDNNKKINLKMATCGR